MREGTHEGLWQDASRMRKRLFLIGLVLIPIILVLAPIALIFWKLANAPPIGW